MKFQVSIQYFGRGRSKAGNGVMLTGATPAFREQIDTGYTGMIPSSDLEEYNEKALLQIMEDTGYSRAEAENFQKDLQEYFGDDYGSFVNGSRPKQVENIDSGLSQMPKYDGSIYRGMSMDSDDTFKHLEAGDEISMKSISSWSSDRSIGTRYSNATTSSCDSIMLVCTENMTGVGVQHLSKWGKMEAEVLAPSTTKWTVKRNQTKTKYDYLKKYYQNMLDSAKTKPKVNMYKKALNELEDKKSLYESHTISIIEVVEG